MAVLLALTAASTWADEHFDIVSFQVDGNTLLPAAELAQLTAPFVGTARVYGDIQQALEALTVAYHQHGYGTVQVFVPEQQLSGGIVRIEVRENTIGNIVVSGNQHFSEDNIRASLPPLQSGKAPNLQQISEAVQLSNENAAKQVSVVLGSSTEEGKIDAEVKVVDNDPLRVLATLDNTGSSSTGKWRTGIALQDANLFNRDQTGTLAYTTSPDSPHGVQVDLYSLGYRIPFYALGDSIDLTYGKSNVNTPGASPTLGGELGFTGKGETYGVHWNHFFSRQGENSSKLVFGIDYKRINSTCNVDGVEISTIGPTPPVASCVPYTLMPWSATYSVSHRGIGRSIDYNIGISRNWATGASYIDTTTDERNDRYSYLTPGSRDTVDDFVILRAGASLLEALSKDWQVHIAANAQYAKDPLVSAEQFGLVGAMAVRGFTERAVTADSAVVVNAELYTPQLPLKGNLRLLTFYDIGRGYNSNIGNSDIPASMTVSSMGVGARYGLGRDLMVKLDLARVGSSGYSATEKRGDLYAHLSATLGF